MPKSLYIDPNKMRAEGKIEFKDIPVNVYKKSVKEELKEGNFTKEDLIRIFRDMTICREFEDMLNSSLVSWTRSCSSRSSLLTWKRRLHIW